MSADTAPTLNCFLTWMTFGTKKTVDAAVQRFDQVEVSGRRRLIVSQRLRMCCSLIMVTGAIQVGHRGAAHKPNRRWLRRAT